MSWATNAAISAAPQANERMINLRVLTVEKPTGTIGLHD